MSQKKADVLLDTALADTFPCSDPVAVGHCEHPGLPSHESDADAAIQALAAPDVAASLLAGRLGIEVWELRHLIAAYPGDDGAVAAGAARLRMRLT